MDENVSIREFIYTWIYYTYPSWRSINKSEPLWLQKGAPIDVIVYTIIFIFSLKTVKVKHFRMQPLW